MGETRPRIGPIRVKRGYLHCWEKLTQHTPTALNHLNWLRRRCSHVVKSLKPLNIASRFVVRRRRNFVWCLSSLDWKKYCELISYLFNIDNTSTELLGNSFFFVTLLLWKVIYCQLLFLLVGLKRNLFKLNKL